MCAANKVLSKSYSLLGLSTQHACDRQAGPHQGQTARTRERQASDSRASVQKLRISPAVQILECTSEEPGKLLWHGVPQRYNAMRPACTKFAPRRCGRVMVDICCDLGGGLARTLKQIREQFHGQYLNTAEACKIQMQSTMQDAMVGPSMAYQPSRTLSLTGLRAAGRTPRALGDVTDCPKLAVKNYAAVFMTLGDVIDRPKARPTLSEFPYAEPIVWLCSGHLAFTRALDTWRCH